jgi:hypothetical protein
MSQAQESRPGREAKAAINLEDTNIISAVSDKHSDAVLALYGVHVVVVTSSNGRTRRHAYWNLPAAQKAVDRATAAGSLSTIVLCQLIPAGGAHE